MKHEKNKQTKCEAYEKHVLQKPCRNCKRGQTDIEGFILCDSCDDGYHLKCLNPPLDEEQAQIMQLWLCVNCQNVKKKVIVREMYCFKCKQILENKVKKLHYQFFDKDHNGEERKIIQIQSFRRCRHCEHDFHEQCFDVQQNSLNCQKCRKSIRKKSPKNHEQFIKYANQSQAFIKKYNYIKLTHTDFCKDNFPKNRKLNLQMYPIPSTWQQTLRIQASLFYALQTDKSHFSKSQLYSSNDIMSLNKSVNNFQRPCLLSDHDEKIYQTYLQYLQQNILPPIEIKQDKIKGFYAVAAYFIPKKSLLCEYVGEVETRTNSTLKYHENDSVMSLIVTQFAQKSLDITPVKFSSFGKFFLCIPEGKPLMKNVETLNFCYKGRSHVIAYTKRQVQKGEILYINYNEGIFQEYPTKDFT